MAVEKTIRYNGGQFNMRASAAVLIAYKEQFGTEYTEDFTAAGKSPLTAIKVGYRLIWAMAKCADRNIADPDIFREELGDDFDLFSAVEAAADLMYKSLDIYGTDDGCNNTDTEDTESDELSERLTISAIRCGFSVADLNDISVGFLLRCIENIGGGKKHEPENEVREATADDVASFVKFLGG
jgi:hypothetical protein